MARSMIKRRQEAARAQAEAYEASLRRMSQPARPAPDFHTAIEEASRGFTARIVRDPAAWRPQMKTRDASRLRLAAARHLFALYPVGAHLEQVWINARNLDAGEVQLRKHWYIVAASGGSLYKEGAGAWLTRKEIHVFLNTSGTLDFEEAMVHAIARSYTDEPGIALRIACTRIATKPRSELTFWREVVRFFCANPASVEDIDDCCDYLADCYARTPGYSLRGRTVASLGRQMHEWHRDLQAIARIETARRRIEMAQARARDASFMSDATASASWRGAPIADWSWRPSAKDRPGRSDREEYVVTQLRTAADLVAETRAMHHCVASYATKCIAGNASIWSLRHRTARSLDRLLTIELDCQARAVQVRGFANRRALPDEIKLLERWAKARNILLR